MYGPNLQSVALAVPEIIVIAVLGGVAYPTPSLFVGYEERRCWVN